MTNRAAYWDNLKYLLITLVVLGHFIDPVTDNYVGRVIFMFIYAFHVPVFVFVSGVFYSERRLGSKILFFVCAGFAMKLLNLLTDVTVRGAAPGFTVLGDKAAPWYLFALAAFLLLRRLLRDRNKWFCLAASIVLGCAAGYDKSIGDTLYLSRIIVFFPFYLAGSMIDRERFPVLIKKRWYAYAAAAAVLVVLFWLCRYRTSDVYVYRHLLTGRNPFSDKVRPYGFLARLGCYAVSAAAGLSVMVLTPARRLGLLTDWGRNTLNVFFWHKFFYFVLVRFTPISEWFYRSTRGQLAYMFVAVALAAALSAVKWFAFPVETIRKQCYLRAPSKSAAPEGR